MTKQPTKKQVTTAYEKIKNLPESQKEKDASKKYKA